MKKILFSVCLLGISASSFAENKTLCTIVTSPCDEVENTLIEGEATYEEIAKAQKQMLKDCGMGN